jgi:dUTP pyrophosphatase
MPDTVEVSIRRLPGADDLPLPAYATAHAAALDLAAAVPAPLTIAPSAIALVPCGFAVALPDGYEAQIRPRSGLAAKHGVTVLNTPGTIDADYRGEVKVILVNLGDRPFEVARGMRIAQLVVAEIPRVRWRETADLSETERGSGGFGHTG